MVHTFTGGADGATGSAGRCFWSMAGFTVQLLPAVSYGSGVVFELTPTAVGEWDFRALYSFHGQPDGSFPYGALLRGPSGKIYGTTYYGGENGIGAVYELSPGPDDVGEWDGRVIYSFQPEAMATVRSATSFATQPAIFTVPRVKAAQEVAQSSS